MIRFRLIPATALLFLSAAVVSCGDRPLEISNMDPRITHESGKVFLLGEPFTGVLRQSIPAVGEKHVTPYRRGVKHGVAVAYHDSGQMIATRSYVAGEKHGVHRTWYNDGADKSYAKFERDRYVKESLGWHRNGRPAVYTRYSPTGETIVFKKWRANGLIYTNLVLKDGVEFGLPGSKVCNPTSETPALAKNERR